MSVLRFLTLTVAVGIIAGLTLTGGAVAQADNETNGTDAPSLNIDTTANVDQNRTAIEQIDRYTTLMEWNYNDDRGGFELLFDSDRPQRMTIQEAVQFEEGTGSGRIYTNRLPSGSAEIFVPVERRAGEAAVSITTEQSLEQNRFSYVSTGQSQPDRPPLDYERVRLMVLLTAFGTAGFVFRVVRKKREDETKEVERIL